MRSLALLPLLLSPLLQDAAGSSHPDRALAVTRESDPLRRDHAQSVSRRLSLRGWELRPGSRRTVADRNLGTRLDTRTVARSSR